MTRERAEILQLAALCLFVVMFVVLLAAYSGVWAACLGLGLFCSGALLTEAWL